MPKRKLNFNNNPMPLKPNKKKAISNKPEKPEVYVGLGSPLKPTPMFSNKQGKPVDINLELRDSQSESSGNKVKNNQKKMSQEFSTSKPRTTSTTSTTPASSTGTSSTTSTPSSFTTTTTTPETTSMGRKSFNNSQKSDNFDARSDRRPSTLGFNGPEVPGGEGFRNPNDNGSIIGQLYGSGSPNKVDFKLNLLCTNYVNDFETSNVTSPEFRAKVVLKAHSFWSQIADAKNTPTNNADYNESLNLIYGKFDRDVGNNLNSYTSPNWSFNTFCDGLTDICKALEHYYFLDSMLAYDAGSMGTDGINRTLQDYKSLFTNNDTLIAARASLRSYLKGCWFPPNFSMLIRWFAQTYKINPLVQSCAFKYIPDTGYFVSSATKDTFLAVPSLTSVINNLKPGTNAAKLSTILNRVYPKGRITSFPESCSDITYDVLMTEVYANDPYGFADLANSNVQSFYPMSYQVNANDVPYYMDADPNPSLNGLAYALQSIPTAKTLTSGYVKDYFSGVRAPLTASIKDKNDIINKTNVQLLVNANSELFGWSPNLTTELMPVDFYQASSVLYTYQKSTAVSNIMLKSQAPANMQRVYFNNYNGPRLLMSEFTNHLFQTRA